MPKIQDGSAATCDTCRLNIVRFEGDWVHRGTLLHHCGMNPLRTTAVAKPLKGSIVRKKAA